jgi:hypothetical protein
MLLVSLNNCHLTASLCCRCSNEISRRTLPHLGGVALRTLTVQANHAGVTTESLHKALHAARIRGSELADQIQKRRAELARVKITAGKRKPTDEVTQILQRLADNDS